MTQTGVLINLSAKGVQNIYLDLSPQYTFFKRSFRRHTNYAVQAVMVTAANQVGFSRTLTFPIPRNGDLLAETYFCAYLPCAGVDTTANMFAKANRGVVTNQGLFGPAHNVMDSRFSNPTHSKWYGHKRSKAALTADGQFTGATAVAEATANVNAGGSAGAFGAQSGAIQRVKNKTIATGGGMIGVPDRVGDNLKTGLAASLNTAADTQMAQQFLTGDDHANVGYVNALGHAMIQEAEFSVGGNSINKFSGEYMHIWHLMHNKSGDHTHDDNLFMYGDGVGAPLSETGSSAPHAIVENQDPLHNELGKYKLARYELKLPKVDGGGSAAPNEPAYKKKAYQLLIESGHQFPNTSEVLMDTKVRFTAEEQQAIDSANSAGLDGPTVHHNQLLSLNFLRRGDLEHGKTPHYLTNAERTAAAINTTYRVKIYDSNGTTELPNAIAKCYLIGQAGTHYPVQHHQIRTGGNVDAATLNKLAPPHATGTGLPETNAAAWKKLQIAQLMPWSKEVLQDSVTVGTTTAAATDTFVSAEASNADLPGGLQDAERSVNKPFIGAPVGCYAISDQRYIHGVTECREVLFGMGRQKYVYDTVLNGAVYDIDTVQHEDIDPIFMQYWDSAPVAPAVAAYKDFATTDVGSAAAPLTPTVFSMTFGTYIKNGAGKLELIGDFFGTYEEKLVTVVADAADNTKVVARTESGFVRNGNTGANTAPKGLANKENVQAFHTMAAKLNKKFGKWFTTHVVFSDDPGTAAVGTGVAQVLHKPDRRLNYAPYRFASNSTEAAIVKSSASFGNVTPAGGQALENLNTNAASGATATGRNRFTRYAKLVFTGTDLLRQTHGRLHISVGPCNHDRTTALNGTGNTKTWLQGYNPTAAVKLRCNQLGNTANSAPFVRYERVNTETHGTSASAPGAHFAIMPYFPKVTTPANCVVSQAAGTSQFGHRMNGVVGSTTAWNAVTLSGSSYMEVQDAGIIVGPSVGRPDVIPTQPSPDAIAFVVYDKVGPNERIIDTAEKGTSSAVHKNARIKFEKVNTGQTGIGFNTTTKDLWVKTSTQTAPVPHSTRMKSGVAIDEGDGVSGLPAALHHNESATFTKTEGFIKDKYRNVIGDATAMTKAAASATAITAVPLLGPSFANAAGTCFLDPLSFYESATGSMVQPLSSSEGFTGADGAFGSAGTEFDQANAVFNTDSSRAGGSHQYISFIGLCPDLRGGGSGTRRASDNQLAMADSASLSASSLGRVQNKAITTKALLQNTGNAVSGTWANTASVSTRQTDARKSTISAMSAKGQAAVRGWDKRHDIGPTATADASSWKSYNHHNKRYWESDYTRVASQEGSVLHKLRNDFVTTTSHASGTVALSVGSKKAIRDGFAKRCHMSAVGNADHPEGTGRCVKVMVPLPFWYSRSGNRVCEAGRTQVLPIIALQYHDCKINVKLRSQTDIIQTDHEARNIGMRCTGMQGLNGSLVKGGAGSQTLDAAVKTELTTMIQDAVLTPAATNGGFAFVDKPTENRVTYQGNGVAYGTEIAAWGGPGKNGKPCKTSAGDGILQAWKTGQAMQTDMGARSCAVPYASGTAFPLTAPGERGGLIDAFILAQTIFLDSNERRLFASHTHEYLITQVQQQEFSVAPQTRPEFQMLTLSCKLNFNHPVSQMYWVCQRPESQATRNWFRYEATHMGGDDLLIKSALTLNSHDREDQEQSDAMFSRVIQPQTYFNTAPAGGASGTIRDPSEGGGKNIYMYSFAAHPKEWWPSGNLNMSRIDTATLKLYMKGHASQAHFGHQYCYAGGGYHKLADEIEFAVEAGGLSTDQRMACYYGTLSKGIDVRVYVQSYNIARIMSGMMALKYAN